MGILSNIEPKEVFQYFEELSMVPRSTFHTKKISDFCVEFAKAHNLEYIQDEMNLSLIHISEPTRQAALSRMPSSA